MNDRHTDDDLRALFDAQRTDDARHAPSFAAMMSRAEAGAAAGSTARAQANAAAAAHVTARRRARHRLEWIGGLAAAAAIAALIVIPRMRDGDDAFEEAVRAFQSDPALGAWQSPTDALLKLPGDGLLTTVPNIGTAQ